VKATDLVLEEIESDTTYVNGKILIQVDPEAKTISIATENIEAGGKPEKFEIISSCYQKGELIVNSLSPFLEYVPLLIIVNLKLNQLSFEIDQVQTHFSGTGVTIEVLDKRKLKKMNQCDYLNGN
ncbi:MAG: hypothetical protein ACI837_003088, partial [Crocinitomicaceae bacterium]